MGFVTRNNRQALAMSLVIVSLASLLAGLLVVQGLRAIATPNWSSSVSTARGPEPGLLRLASQATLFDPEDADSLGSLRKSPLGQWACAA